MERYIQNYINIINNCSYDNTYKMAWAKALVELSCEIKSADEIVTISFESIAGKYIKYYFNQTIYFDLIQGSNIKKIPEILQYTKILIEELYNAKGDRNPIRFERVLPVLNKYNLISTYNNCIKKISNTLKKDVSYRFLNVGKEKYDLYELDRKKGELYIESSDLKLLKKYSIVLFQIINYRWAQMLETFNTSPRIAMKVRATHEENGVRRKSLTPFRKYLDLMNTSDKPICFFCGKEIEEKDISIDHIIPWSFMYSDDIWNLVYSHKSENSSKSNILVDESIINQLELRNNKLLEKLVELNINNKMYDELKLAIEYNYVRKFWMAAKG